MNEAEHTIAARYEEWLVFSQNILSLDRTKFNYTIVAKCNNGILDLTLSRINYSYEENRPSGFKANAEELISDKASLNKNGTKLQRMKYDGYQSRRQKKYKRDRVCSKASSQTKKID